MPDGVRVMYCAVCLGIESETPAEPITIIHGYAVCSEHMPLMQAGTIWPDVLYNARGGPKDVPPPERPHRKKGPSRPITTSEDGVNIWQDLGVTEGDT